MTEVELIEGTGTSALLPGLLTRWVPRRVFVVAGRTGLDRSGLAARLDPTRTTYFSDFTPNPQLRDVLAGCAAVAATRPDLVVGVGGGSALDVAKLVRALPADRDAALRALNGTAAPQVRAPLVLVPTTAGTGSEVTRFATVYVDGVKHSLDHALVRADLAVVDPDLATGCPDDVTFSGLLDALAHAVESLWSLRSTTDTRVLAADALATVVSLFRAGRRPLTTADRVAAAAAATRAGLAIDHTRTTAGHAFAYPLTSRYGIRHGLACALNLVWLLPHTAGPVARECQDPRGAAFVGRRLDQIAAGLGAADPAGGAVALAALIRAAGFPVGLAAHGVPADQLPALVSAGLGHGRSGNGPVRLSPAGVLSSLRAHYEATR